jgi:putative aldouronate transport system permease protein
MGIVFTMYFSGGLIPNFLLVRAIGIYNTRWALILPGAIATWNLIVMKTSFQHIPASLEESARMDGANDFIILFRIFLPVASATLAVMTLFYAVGHWNAWFNAMLFIQSPKKYPLQVVLRQILLMNKNSSVQAALSDSSSALLMELIKYALIVISTAPILLLYPFLQKFFTKGVLVGAIKG